VWLGLSIFGIELSSACVYGCFMRANSTGVAACSTTLPPYITAISSVRPATTPRSCVTRIIAMCRSFCCCWSRLRICACTVTSSAVVGSSANSSLGPQARAMEIVTRWRMPPDSWWGYSPRRWDGSGMPTELSSAIAVSWASTLSMSRWKRSDSVICRPILMTGLSEVIGSWKTIDISEPHTLRISSGSTR
jgi:hypothetical protein